MRGSDKRSLYWISFTPPLNMGNAVAKRPSFSLPRRDQRRPLPDDDERDDGESIESAMEGVSRSVYLRGEGKGIISHYGGY